MPQPFSLVLTLSLAAALAGCGGKNTSGSDRSQPRKAVVALMLAIDARDAGAVRQSFSQKADPAYVESLLRVLAAQAKLKDAVRARAGRENAKQLDALGPVKEDIAAWQTARESIDGEQATVSLPGGPQLRLSREDGQWKILADSQSDLGVARQVLERVASAMEQVAGELNGPRYASLDPERLVREVRKSVAEQVAR